MEVRKILKVAVSNLNIDQQQKEELLNAIWENFDHFEIISNIPDDSTTFLTTNKTKRFRKENFISAYLSGEMDIEDMVYILF